MNSKFVLLDFGYPMSANTIKNIINSLENILLLSLAFSQSKNETNFNISVLSSPFAIIYFEPNLRRNYFSVVKNFNDFLNKASGRVTVQEFKNLLSSSIAAILREHQKKFNDQEILSEQSTQIAVVSKKTAWILADILASVSKTQQITVENFKIVQIVNNTQHKNEEKNALIDCIFCFDEPRHLNAFFKNWLLNSQQELRILISKDANLELKCEVEDFVVNPISFSSKFDLFDDIRAKWGSTLIDISTQVRKLEIINRLPVNGLCPTLVFGIPRQVRAIRSTEFPTNSRVFKQLCRELNRTGEGLLAKSGMPTNLATFHFLTSDGDMILMNDVAPNELHLQKREEFSNCTEAPEDERDTSVLRDCLQKIKFLYEFKPEDFSSGVIELSRHYFNRLKHSKTAPVFLNSSVSVEKKNDNQRENCKSDQGKRTKSNSAKKQENVHPALLSPELAEKYRKIDKRAFNLPELGEEFTECFEMSL